MTAGGIQRWKTGNQHDVQTELTRRLSTALAVVILAVGGVGCGGGGPDIAGDICKKADACSFLSGITAAQCKEVVDKSLASMTGPARTNTEAAYRACLGMTECAGFNSCIDGVMQGSTTGTGGSS